MIKQILISLFVMMGLIGSARASIVFQDDFESGLGEWDIGGRQTAGINIADTVSRHGSMMGHLYKTSFTEITLCRNFDYDPDIRFHFNMEVNATSTTPPSPNYYGGSGVRFLFFDENDVTLGWVGYYTATTSFIFDQTASDPLHQCNQVPAGQLDTYDLGTQDLLSQIAINEADIDSVSMQFECYSSTYPNPVISAELWVDQVVVPEPATMLLLGLGGLMLRGKKSA